MPKNVQTIVQFCSFHTLARLCSKSFKIGFSSMWTEKFQVYKLDWEKAKEPEMKLATSVGSIGSVFRKKQDIALPTKVHLVKAMVFPVVMYGCVLDYKESWALKNWCFWTVVLEKTLENPLDSKEIQPVHPKENQSWIFIGRTDAEAETPILWPPDTKNWHIWKDPDAGKVWRQEEKGMTEDEMAGWNHWLNGHEFE